MERITHSNKKRAVSDQRIERIDIEFLEKYDRERSVLKGYKAGGSRDFEAAKRA